MTDLLSMPRLTEEVKRFIVMDLATLRPPSEVAERVKEVFGIDVDRRQVHEYHPERIHKAPVAKKWVKLFEETRREFHRSAGKVPIALKAYRLRELNDMYFRAKQAGNFVLAAELLQQAAKECGDAFTNTRQITGKDGRPVEFRDVSDLTDEQLEAELRRLLGGCSDGV